MRIIKNKKGITLISLVITIIVLLILAGVTISTLLGENGIITRASKAKEETEKANIEEMMKISVIEAMAESEGTNITKESLKSALENNFKNQTIELYSVGEDYAVVFLENKLTYTIDRSGKINSSGIIENQEYAGDITKNKKYDGSEQKPYQITCIEDLVYFSYAINNRTISIECYVELAKDLDFKSIASYGNYKTTYSYSSEKNNYIVDETSETPLIEIINKGLGFISISSSQRSFMGNFNGKGFFISNMYQNQDAECGLFYRNYGTIANLNVTGEIITTKDAGGITYTNGTLVNGKYKGTIYGCANYINIISSVSTSYAGVGGVVGINHGNINQCQNFGNINSSSNSGGIAGISYGEGSDNILNCSNNGIIISSGTGSNYSNAGGIVRNK